MSVKHPTKIKSTPYARLSYFRSTGHNKRGGWVSNKTNNLVPTNDGKMRLAHRKGRYRYRTPMGLYNHFLARGWVLQKNLNAILTSKNKPFEKHVITINRPPIFLVNSLQNSPINSSQTFFYSSQTFSADPPKSTYCCLVLQTVFSDVVSNLV